MKIIGYRRSDFATKEGVEVTGFMVTLAREINPKIGNGVETETMYFSTQKLANSGYELEDLLDSEIKINYNRYGKLDNFVVID